MNGNRATVVQLLIQGGAVGITILVVILWARFMNDYALKSVEVQTQLSANVEQQTEAIDNLVEVVRDWRRLATPNITINE